MPLGKYDTFSRHSRYEYRAVRRARRFEAIFEGLTQDDCTRCGELGRRLAADFSARSMLAIAAAELEYYRRRHAPAIAQLSHCYRLGQRRRCVMHGAASRPRKKRTYLIASPLRQQREGRWLLGADAEPARPPAQIQQIEEATLIGRARSRVTDLAPSKCRSMIFRPG